MNGQKYRSADPLSDALAVMHLQSSGLGIFKFDTPWGVEHPSLPGFVCHVVADGECWYLPAAPAQALLLRKGDFIAFPHGDRHVLASGPQAAVVPVQDLLGGMGLPLWTPDQHDAHPVRYTAPEGSAAAVVFDLISTFHDPHNNPLLRSLPPVIHIPADAMQVLPWLTFIADLTVSEQGAAVPGYTAMMRRIADLVFIQAMRAYLNPATDKIGPSRGALRGMLHPRISRSLQAIHRAPQRDWTVAALAAEAGMARTAFAQEFHACLGCPPIYYVTEWRMYVATRDLAAGVPANIVAKKLGYASPASFARAFSRIHGRNPGDYRRQEHRCGGAE